MNKHKIGHHISEQFNLELEEIRNKVLTMAGLIEQQLALAAQAFAKGDTKLAELVIKQDNQVDQLEMEIDLQCMQVMALRQPTAFDLRLLLTVIKIIHELERIGDRAESIAEKAIKLATPQNNFPHHELSHMTDVVKSMLHDALDAFARLTLDNVSAIIEREQEVDREYENILRQLSTRMMEDPRNISLTLEVLWTVRELERIGDNACYICEHLAYLIKGEDLRHLSHSAFETKAATPA